MVSVDYQQGVSIIVPAWNEEKTISECLYSILHQKFPGAMQVIIVANGCQDSTVVCASRFKNAFEQRSIQFDVIETSLNSKPDAIHRGEMKACFGNKVYLDADVTLSADAIQVICQALAVDEPLLVSPKALFYSPASLFCRCHLYVFKHFPPMLDDVVGMGCYAVNTKGRLRWDQMPQLIADDAYVRSFFSKNERLLLDNIYFHTSFPEFGHFFPVLERWHRGNMELKTIGREFYDESLFRRRLLALLRKPVLIIFLPIYFLNNTLAKFYAQINLRRKKTFTWIRER